MKANITAYTLLLIVGILLCTGLTGYSLIIGNYLSAGLFGITIFAWSAAAKNSIRTKAESKDTV